MEAVLEQVQVDLEESKKRNYGAGSKTERNGRGTFGITMRKGIDAPRVLRVRSRPISACSRSRCCGRTANWTSTRAEQPSMI